MIKTKRKSSGKVYTGIEPISPEDSEGVTSESDVLTITPIDRINLCDGKLISPDIII